MLDPILDTLKNEITSKLVMLGIDPRKNDLVIKLAKLIIINSLRMYSSIYTIKGVQELFKSTEPLNKNLVVQGMMSDYACDLANRLSLEEKNAEAVSKFIIPFVLAQVSNRVNRNPESLKSLLSENGLISKLKLMSALTLNSILV